MPILYENKFMPGKYNSYLIGSNVCNAFAIGEIGSSDDFFLLGIEPEDESIYPLLTGNILDSEGNVLLRIVRNLVIFNPGHCSKISGNMIGYEIYDVNDVLVFKIDTRFEDESDTSGWITTIAGSFYDKNQELAFEARNGGPGERIIANTKCGFGFTGSGFVCSHKMSQQDMQLAAVVMSSHGRIHKMIAGHHEGEQITLDGTVLCEGTKLINCDITVSSGNFGALGKFEIGHCRVGFAGEAKNIKDLLEMLATTQKAT